MRGWQSSHASDCRLAFSLGKKMRAAEKKRPFFFGAVPSHLSFFKRKGQGSAAIGIDECNSRTPLYAKLFLLFAQLYLMKTPPHVVRAPSFVSPSKQELDRFSERLAALRVKRGSTLGVQVTAEALDAAGAKTIQLLKTFAEARGVKLVPLDLSSLDRAQTEALFEFGRHASRISGLEYDHARSALQDVINRRTAHALNVIDEHKPSHLVLNIPFAHFKV